MWWILDGIGSERETNLEIETVFVRERDFLGFSGLFGWESEISWLFHFHSG